MAVTVAPNHDKLPFELGVTRSAADAAVAANARLVDRLLRHLSCDWGDLDADDQAVNNHAVQHRRADPLQLPRRHRPGHLDCHRSRPQRNHHPTRLSRVFAEEPPRVMSPETARRSS
jgi:hypothetical protein